MDYPRIEEKDEAGNQLAIYVWSNNGRIDVLVRSFPYLNSPVRLMQLVRRNPPRKTTSGLGCSGFSCLQGILTV